MGTFLLCVIVFISGWYLGRHYESWCWRSNCANDLWICRGGHMYRMEKL